MFDCIGNWTIAFSIPITESQLYCKPQVACFTALRVDKEVGKQILIVGTTHLIFNNNRGDQKLAQLDLTMQCFDYIRNSVKAMYPDHHISFGNSLV